MRQRRRDMGEMATVTHHGSPASAERVEHLSFQSQDQEILNRDRFIDSRRCHFCSCAVSDFVRFEFLIHPRRREHR